MQRFKAKKQSNINCILSPSVLASCLMSIFPFNAVADHLDLLNVEVNVKRLYDMPSGDTASLLEINPSVDLYQAGGTRGNGSIAGHGPLY